MTDADVIEQIISREGGDKFTHDVAGGDPPTRWGVTDATLGDHRKLGRKATPEEVQALTGAEARDIYRSMYIEQPGFFRVVDDRLRAFLVDSAVQHGPETAITFLQTALGTKGDGMLGDLTLAKLEAAQPDWVYRETWAERARYYAHIIRNKPEKRKYSAGWFNRLSEFV
jgi:lysozyme family protein